MTTQDFEESSLITLRSERPIGMFRRIMEHDNSSNPIDSSHSWRNKCRKRISVIVLILFTVSITLTGVGIADMIHEQNKAFSSTTPKNDGVNITMSPSESPTTIYERDLNDVLEKYLGDRMKAAFEVDSSQWKARMWMVEEDLISVQQFFQQEEKMWLVIQRYALLTIFFEFSGTGLNKIDWLNVPECQSKLVLCDDDGRVRSLELDDVLSDSVSSIIPKEIGLLVGLEHLIIKNNERLVGEIPKEIGELIGCYQLGIYNNHIQGPIPTEIAKLEKLIYLNFSDNHLTGEVPNEIGALVNLKRLILDGNQLMGNIIPTHYSEMENLKVLSLSNNSFSGSLIQEIKFLQSVEYLYLDRNSFSGSLPSELGLLFEVKSLALGYNNFNHEIPKQIGKLTQLEFLSLNNNQMNGTVGDLFQDMVTLNHLYLHNNDFSDNLVGSPSCSLRQNRLIDFWVDCGGLNASINCPVECCTKCCLKDECY